MNEKNELVGVRLQWDRSSYLADATAAYNITMSFISSFTWNVKLHKITINDRSSRQCWIHETQRVNGWDGRTGSFVQQQPYKYNNSTPGKHPISKATLLVCCWSRRGSNENAEDLSLDADKLARHINYCCAIERRRLTIVRWIYRPYPSIGIDDRPSDKTDCFATDDKLVVAAAAAETGALPLATSGVRHRWSTVHVPNRVTSSIAWVRRAGSTQTGGLADGQSPATHSAVMLRKTFEQRRSNFINIRSNERNRLRVTDRGETRWVRTERV